MDDDLIRRSELKERFRGFDFRGGAFIERTIDDIPPADARMNTYGEWEEVPGRHGSTDFRCSACHKYRFHNGAMRKRYWRCPRCGAIMNKKGESE